MTTAAPSASDCAPSLAAAFALHYTSLIRAWIWRNPSIALVFAALISVMAFPASAAGAVGVLVLCAALGVATVLGWPRLPERLKRSRPRLAHWIALLTVVAGAIALFTRFLSHTRGWPLGDWGPQHAVLRGVVDHMRSWTLPHWNQRLATGDSPLEVYPALTYVLMGAIALATGATDLPTLMITFAVAVHVLFAIGVTRLALRVASPVVATIVGLCSLADAGGISSGGIVGTIEWGLIHSAVAQLFALVAVTAVVDALRRPRLRTSIAIWVFFALSTAAHPCGLLSAAAVAIALAGTALLARDVPSRRALVALSHVGVGVALGAIIWPPCGERILLYGQHFSNVLEEPGRWLQHILAHPIPDSSFVAVVYAGYAGMVAAILSRRATPIVIATTGLVLLLGFCDAPYLASGLAPSQTVARLGAERFFALSRPFVFVGAAYLGTILIGHVKLASGRTLIDARSSSRVRSLACLPASAAVPCSRCATSSKSKPLLWLTTRSPIANRWRNGRAQR